jgi:uncharacterized protein YprB with RNaseH-like and TPR domain
MLENTFCHIPGIGVKAERRLWDAGLHSWEAARREAALPLGERTSALVREALSESVRHLAGGNPRYFADSLGSAHQWRMFREFRGSVAYLDIETTGLGPPRDHITTIALYDGRRIRHYVRGENLDAFAGDIEQYGLLVTYNGKSFDVPFIRAEFGIPVPQAHIDLRYVLARLGYRGGLKGCEKALGIDRGEVDGLDGYFAVLLWQEYRRTGDRRALETLLAYNVMDVVGLETLMVHAYNRGIAGTPFQCSHVLELPAEPQLPFRVDRDTIGRIRRRYRL